VKLSGFDEGRPSTAADPGHERRTLRDSRAPVSLGRALGYGGAGLLFAGLVLHLINFPTAISEHGAATAAVAEQTARWLGPATQLGAGLIAFAGTALVLLYRLDAQACSSIMADPAIRRSA
jgi:hypothetical protein